MFIHGLTGNRRSTWTKDWTFKGRKETTFWPKELLPEDVKDVRILTWGYDADVVRPELFRMASNNDIKAHAGNLCTDLANMRTDCPQVSRRGVVVSTDLRSDSDQLFSSFTVLVV